jgi:hypothetical protein
VFKQLFTEKNQVKKSGAPTGVQAKNKKQIMLYLCKKNNDAFIVPTGLVKDIPGFPKLFCWIAAYYMEHVESIAAVELNHPKHQVFSKVCSPVALPKLQ